MSLRGYLIILGFGTSLCWLAFFSVIFLINPEQAEFLAFLFFYLSLGFALIGTFAASGTLIRYVFAKDEMAHKHVSIASRQSVLFAGLILLSLFLQSQRLLAWWNLIILVVVAALIELFFISYRKSINRVRG